MLSISLSNLTPSVVSLALAVALTPVMRAISRRLGFVARPTSDRWHKKPTAMMGGVAIWLAVIVTYLSLVPHSRQGWVVVGASSFLFLVGVTDDILHIKPYQKLIGQVMGAAIAVNYGLSLPWTRSFSVNMVITIFWLIGITNAINLLDNMDGLATGIAAIASGFLTLSFVANNQPTEALMMAVFAAALLGFLVYNSHPASIFMGDCGSMFIGFFLASAALVNIPGGRSRSIVPVLAVPILGVYLAGVRGYDEEEQAAAARKKPLFTFLVDFSYKRRIFEVLLDVILIILAYWSAYAIKFEPFSGSPAWKLFLRTLPVLVVVRLLAFLFFGVYRGIWRYTSIDDLMAFAKAVAAGSIISMTIILFKFRFQGFSRAIFVIDALVMLMLLAGSRVAFRFFRQVLPTANGGAGRRVLIYGAGDAGELLLRDLLNNRELLYAPVGFMDDDPKKQGKVIHGLRVFGGNGLFPKIVIQQNVEQVLISTPRITEERIAELLSECETRNIDLKRMSIKIETLDKSGFSFHAKSPANDNI